MMTFQSCLLMSSCDDLITMSWWLVGLQDGVPAGGCGDVQRKALGAKGSLAPFLHPGSQLPSLPGLSLELKHLSIFPSPSWALLGDTHGSCVFCRVSWAAEDDRRPMNKTQTCLFCAILSKWCISNEVFAVSCFCLLINETFPPPVLFLACEVTGKCEGKAVNWTGLGSACFMMVLI